MRTINMTSHELETLLNALNVVASEVEKYQAISKEKGYQDAYLEQEKMEIQSLIWKLYKTEAN